MIYDKKDNLWLVNNCTSSIIKVIKSDGSWVKLEIPEIERIETFEHMMFDRRGWLWINAMWDNRAYDIPGFSASIIIIHSKINLMIKVNSFVQYPIRMVTS